MSTPNTTISASTPSITEQRVVFFTRVISQRAVSRSFIDQRDHTILQLRQRTAIDDYKHLKNDVQRTRAVY